MSEDKKLFRVRLKKAKSIATPHGKMVQGQDRFLNDDSPSLAYYRRNFNTFEVRAVDEIETAKPASTLARRRKRGENKQELKPEVQPEAPAPAVAKESDEDEVREAYTEKALKREKREKLVAIAEGEFELEVKDTDLKREIIAKILAADQD